MDSFQMINSRLNQLFSFLEAQPNDAFILFAIAKEYEKLEEKANALAYFLKLIELDPTYIGTYYHLGKLYETLDQAENALATYEKGILVAQNANDQHALAELMNAKMNCEMEL